MIDVFYICLFGFREIVEILFSWILDILNIDKFKSVIIDVYNNLNCDNL